MPEHSEHVPNSSTAERWADSSRSLKRGADGTRRGNARAAAKDPANSARASTMEMKEPLPRRSRRASVAGIAPGEVNRSARTEDGTRNVPSAVAPSPITFGDFFAYQRDLWERTILFWDTLRQRADNMLAHERAGKPPLLDFDYELILDARRFQRPVNYALLRVTRYAETCLEDCLDPTKPPLMIVDPRAGHGPGIGGFKRESEVGIALREGYPVYFVIFYPEPSPGQTLIDVLRALRRFVEDICKRHKGRSPILYGNCQAGWAITILAADCQGLVGPAVLNGSPLSYWAGESGVNPARVSGGLLGGAWLAHLAADLGNGRFDGAWLVHGFENLKPEAVWDKYANIFLYIDSERERFLDFERWWNGFYFLSRDEILDIIENLFVGDRLEQGTLRVCPGCFVDLRRIRNPLVIFASYGDNITPPHQALGWIPIMYADTEDLKRAGQRIVYLINPHVGHLGIFVSASVARFEHRAILESLEKVEALPPGLYEMKIDNPTGDPECGHDAYSVRFEERRVEDLHFAANHSAFARVAEVSKQIDDFYSVTFGRWVRTISTPLLATALEWLHPMRTSRYIFATPIGPWQQIIAGLASSIEKDRHAVADESPLKAAELHASAAVHDFIEQWRRFRDLGYERLFLALYGGTDRATGAQAQGQTGAGFAPRSECGTGS